MWVVHLRNERITSQSKAVACCSGGHINGLRGGESNRRKEQKTEKNKNSMLYLSFKMFPFKCLLVIVPFCL